MNLAQSACAPRSQTTIAFVKFARVVVGVMGRGRGLAVRQQLAGMIDDEVNVGMVHA